MSSVHVFCTNEFGVACIRCGYFSHTQEAGKDCSGAFDEKLLHDLETQIKQAQMKRDRILAAQVTQHDSPYHPSDPIGGHAGATSCTVQGVVKDE